MADYNPYNPGENFTVTSGYPARPNGDAHGGIDFYAPPGTFVPAAGNGYVVRSEWSDQLGWVIVIQHKLPDGSSFYTRYSHLNGADMKKVGAYVISGEKIGEVGNTPGYPYSRGPHLHYDIPITPTSVSNPNPKNTRDPYTQKFPDGGPFDAAPEGGGGGEEISAA